MTTATTSDVPMPRLSDGMEEGTILSWLVAEGDPVSPGDPLVEIETDKASMVHEAEAGGLLQVVAQAGATVAVGEVIARLVPAEEGGGAGAGTEPEAAEPQAAGPQAGEPRPAEPQAGEGGDTGAGDAPAGAAPDDPAPPPARSAPDGDAAPPAPARNGAAQPGRATPVARRLAEAHGVELSTVEGTGPGGRIRSRDVRAAAGLEPPGAEAAPPAAAPPAPAPPAAAAPLAAAAAPTAAGLPAAPASAKGAVEVVELSRTRATIARRMAQAKATIPEFVVEREAGLDALLAFRAALKGQLPEGTVPPSLNDFVVAAVARALAADRTLNASWREGRVERYGRVNVGVAVAAPGGLVVPVVHDADALPLGAIARRTRALAAAAREGRLTPPDLAGGTFTVSNLGMMGVTRLVPIINDPQAGILGVGRAVARVVLQDGVPVERTEMALTLAGDHRVADGADGAAFLAAVCELLEAPAVLALG